MTWTDNRLRLVVALLLVVSAAVFAVGTAIEHSRRGDLDEAAVSAVSPSGSGGEAEHADEDAEGAAQVGESVADEAVDAEHSEEIAGIDPESWQLAGLAILVSLALAAGVYWRQGRWFLAALGLGILFAAADARELVHQLDESNTAVAAIAAILAVLHLLVALTAGFACLRRARSAGRLHAT